MPRGSHGSERLTRDRVVAAAAALADRTGVGALTMRALAESLGVAPMSLYHHLPNKEALLDAAVDAVFAEVDLPVPGHPWRSELRRRSASLRQVLGRHPWALALMESRTAPGPDSLRHRDAVLGTLRAAGFDLPTTAHAYAVLDAFVYGFALQEATLPITQDGVTPPDVVERAARELAPSLAAGGFAHLAEFVTGHALQPGYSFAASFDVGLDLVLDGLERLRRGSARAGGAGISAER